MSLNQKLKRYQTLKRQIAELERDIKTEGREVIYREQGILTTPRIETLMQRIAA